MGKEDNLKRFVVAQEAAYENALLEIKNAKKRSHWMWYIFPQLKGLGFSETSQYYGIADQNEAEQYLNHPILGNRLINISRELLMLETNDAYKVFGSPDDLKLSSSMTLFSSLQNTDPVFQLVVNKFFNGKKDNKTLQLLKN